MSKPVYLLADSQLLFWKENDRWFSQRIREDMEPKRDRAAYIGASNGDDVQFYEMFRAAMEMIGLSQCRMIPSRPSGEDMTFLEEAGLVLLSGGDVERGWRTLEENGVRDMILRKRYDGTVMVGVSAGAVQLGLGALTQATQPQKLETLRFAPFFIGAHDENQDWWDLRALVKLAQNDVRAVGIPAGAGAIYHYDGTLEPIRKVLVELLKEEGKIKENTLVPARTEPLNSAPGS
jgi:peptidase E